MKYLPCPTCRQPALATRSGILHSAGQLSTSPLTYLCKRCGHLCSITILDFSRLPEMTRDQIAATSCDLNLADVIEEDAC